MSPTGNRIKLPEASANACASCTTERRNVRRGWEPITRAGAVVGWTCPSCPRVDEPIRRLATKAGVRFRVVVDATPRGASKRRQVTATLPTLDAARAKVEEVRAEVAKAGEYAPPPAESVRALADRWLASRVDVRPVTREGYRGALVPVLRYLGDRDAASLTPADARELVAWLSEHGGKATKNNPEGRALAPRSVRAALVALGQVFDMGVTDGTLTRNVVRGVKRPRQAKTVGRDLDHWDWPTLTKFRAHADSDPLAGAWRLSLAGLRRSEVLGLRWSDVDLETGEVRIAQGRVALDHGSTVDDPKSGASRRSVSVEAAHPGTVALLKSLRARQAADKLKAGEAYNDSGLIVVDELGEPVAPQVYSDRFTRLCAAAEVPPIKLHNLRHSLAFRFIELGVSPADAAAYLGHTAEVFLSTYLPHSGTVGITAAAAALGRVASAES